MEEFREAPERAPLFIRDENGAREQILAKKITVVLPAYNAAQTLRRTIADLPTSGIDDIILVDDASLDNTADIAADLGLHVVRHSQNTGYGGNQKTCYRTALQRGADVVVMVHPDHQYDPALVPAMIRPILEKRCDAVFGSRMMIRGDALKGKMPLWKYIANIALTHIENAVLRLKLTEYHSGFRAYSRAALETIPFQENANGFVFDTEIIVQLKLHDFHIEEIPIPTRYFKEASTVGLKTGVRYGLSILRVMSRYTIHKVGLKKYANFS